MNSLDTTCRIRGNNCWYRHDKQTYYITNEKKEVTENIFQMMEKFPEMIMDLEFKLR